MNPIGQTIEGELFALTGSGTIPAQTDRNCMLNQLFPETNPELWLGILLKLRKKVPGTKNSYEVRHVSILAFQGVTSQTLDPSLRAEWDLEIARSRSVPAQPHWHAYATSMRNQDRFTDESYQELGSSIEVEGGSKERQHKMHFALCANWHKKNGSHFEVLNTPEELKSWIVGALQYIKSQL